MDNVLLKTKLLNELPAVINNLSSEQKTIIDATDNIITVIAGAGAGKTTVMVLKALKTLLDGKNNILILTFSNEGVNSLRKKVDYYFSLLVKTAFLTDDDIEQIDLLKRKINISTFHAMAYKVLLFNKVNITILLEKERLALIKEILIKENSNLDAKKVNTKINYYQCNQKHARDIVSEATEEFKDIYLQYEQYCKENNVVDFNELQMRFINFLKTTEELLFKEYSLFVDEFQDTDLNQIEIIKALKAKGKINSIVAIGDPRQSIYMFRGASPSNIDNFSKDFNSQVFYLNNNYRSNTIIVEKANRLIKSG